MNIQPISLIMQYGRLCCIAAMATANPAQAMSMALELPEVPGSARMRLAVARKVVRCHRQRQEVHG